MENLVKICRKCKLNKPIEEYYALKTGHNQKHPWCKLCVSDYNKARYPDKYLKEKLSGKLKHAKHRRDRIKQEVFSHYSDGTPKCACCGESEIKFLSIDHINNDGGVFRKAGGRGGAQFYAKLKRQDYPQGLQVLCFNCNCAKAYYGICPHQLLPTLKGGPR